MIKINNIKLNLNYNESDILSVIYKNLRVKSINSYKILKESLDSRHHEDIHYQLSVGVFVDNESKIMKSVNNKNIMLTKEVKYTFPHILNTEIREALDEMPEFRPVIIGAGPAGYHAAIKLCQAGFRPIVIERGKAVEDRARDVDQFWENGKLKLDSNVCFGEGGAGTFSDGKLNTGNKDKGGYFKEVLETFVRYGADESVAYKAKPHIGTDVLRSIMTNMRHDIERLGGEVRFENKLIDLEYETYINTFGYESELPIYKLKLESPGGTYDILTHSVILAIGHSARDTYEMLYNRSLNFSPKPFAVGVRVEHKSEMINKAMYGEDYKERSGDALPTADYKLVYHTEKDRSVFSFCMCPGGYVVNSSTEEGETVINGMSYSGRAGENSNSAIVVSITPEDYNGSVDKPLEGIYYQKALEKKAFNEAEGGIPVQLYKDLKEDRSTTELGEIMPEIKGKWTFANLRNVFPEYITDSILESMEYFGTRINGYDRDDTVMSAVESRTSSPVRIDRGEDMMALNFPGIVPTGEGAGYAGGITSAAADGIKAAEAVATYITDDLIRCYIDYESSKYL